MAFCLRTFLGIGFLIYLNSCVADVSIKSPDLLEQQIADSYEHADYRMTARLLKQNIAQLEGKHLTGDKNVASSLLRKRYLLAHTYAWKLNKPRKALAEYRKISETRRKEGVSISVPVEYLYMAEIYESRKKYSKSLRYYKDLLDTLKTYPKSNRDYYGADELASFVKYRIDGVTLKTSKGKDFEPLFRGLDLSRRAANAASTIKILKLNARVAIMPLPL